LKVVGALLRDKENRIFSCMRPGWRCLGRMVGVSRGEGGPG